MATIGIAVGAYYKDSITDPMLDKAKECIEQKGAKIGPIIEVPGAFDVPFAVQKLLESQAVDAVITLGAIIQGETDHDGVIGYAVAQSLHNLSLQYKKPVTLGIVGPKITWQQAVDRIDKAAEQSVNAAIKLLGI